MAWSVAGNIRGPQGIQGVKGDPGNAGATGPAGPAGLTWRGAWSNANSYAINDSVGWGGSTYFATVAKAAGSPPPTGTAADPGTNDTGTNEGWQALSLEGAQGPQGVPGSPGAKGDTGNTGATGTRGTNWYTGVGAPGTIAGSLAGDKYLDTSSGDVFTLV